VKLVQVNWKNVGYDYVPDFMLDDLIEAGVVARFLRDAGWVTIGVDPVRSSSQKSEYSGRERRSERYLTESPGGQTDAVRQEGQRVRCR
jgi:hypothetical protein